MKRFHHELVLWKFASANKEQGATARSSGVYIKYSSSEHRRNVALYPQ